MIYFVTSPINAEMPLSHARIGYQTITRTGSASASTSAIGYPGDAPTRPDTYERWKPTAVPAWWRVDAGAAAEVNYIGIAAHTLDGRTVQVQYSADGSVWTNYGSDFTPADRSPIMIIGDAVQARYWRIYISAGSPPEIGVIYVGKLLEMQRMIYGGHSPISLSRETIIKPNTSEGGQFIGRSIIRRGVKTSADFRNLTPAWYREKFDPFVKSAREYPFFFAWRPATYPNEIGYVWVSDDIAPSNSSAGAGWMQVSMSMTGFADAD